MFRYAIATSRAERNPAANLKGALAPVTQKHHASITDPTEIGKLLRAIEDYRGIFVTRCALRLAPLFFVRPGELRHAEWSEFDLGNENGWNRDAIERQLAHAEYLPERRNMIQWWADYLEKLTIGAEVIPLNISA